MHPIVRHDLAMRAFGLGNFVFMMRKLKINPATMNVDRLAEMLCGHGRAFDMPAGTSPAPRAVPDRIFWFTFLGEFPEREVGGVAFVFVDSNACAGFIVFELATRQLSIIRHGIDRKPDAFLADIGIALADELLDHLDHFADMIGRPRLNAGREHVQCSRVGIVDLGEFLRNRLNRFAGLDAGLDDLVFNVGDVARVDHRILTIHPHQQAPQHIEHNGRTRIADMGVIVDSRAADIHRHARRILRMENALFARGGVVDADCHGFWARFRKSGRIAGATGSWPALMAC